MKELSKLNIYSKEWQLEKSEFKPLSGFEPYWLTVYLVSVPSAQFNTIKIKLGDKTFFSKHFGDETGYIHMINIKSSCVGEML